MDDEEGRDGGGMVQGKYERSVFRLGSRGVLTIARRCFCRLSGLMGSEFGVER